MFYILFHGLLRALTCTLFHIWRMKPPHACVGTTEFYSNSFLNFISGFVLDLTHDLPVSYFLLSTMCYVLYFISWFIACFDLYFIPYLKDETTACVFFLFYSRSLLNFILALVLDLVCRLPVFYYYEFLF